MLLLNQQRLELALNHRGTVLSLNPGASKAVFDVEPSELVGKPLSSFINVFGQWKAKYGSEEGLLTKLALRVEQSHDVVVRCGLHNPFSEVRGCIEVVGVLLSGRGRLPQCGCQGNKKAYKACLAAGGAGESAKRLLPCLRCPALF